MRRPLQTRAEAECYLYQLAQRMRLGHWTFEVTDQTPPKTDLARVFPVTGQCRAVVQLSPQFFTDTLDNQRHTLVHELAHLPHYPVWEMVRDDLREHLKADAHGLFFKSFRRQHELAVDWQADVLAPLMPYPKIRRARKPRKVA